MNDNETKIDLLNTVGTQHLSVTKVKRKFSGEKMHLNSFSGGSIVAQWLFL